MTKKQDVPHLLPFFQSFGNHILKNKDFESKLKKTTIEMMYTLLEDDVESPELSKNYLIFVENVNNLNKYPFSEPLFMLLVKHVEKSLIQHIFKDLLNLNQSA